MSTEGSRSAASTGWGLDWEFALALGTYAAASTSDFLITLTGLLGQEMRELNPILDAYIQHLGAAYGLAVPKLLLGTTAVLASSLYIRAMHRARRTRIRAEHILYAGALFTAVAPLHGVILGWWTP